MSLAAGAVPALVARVAPALVGLLACEPGAGAPRRLAVPEPGATIAAHAPAKPPPVACAPELTATGANGGLVLRVGSTEIAVPSAPPSPSHVLGLRVFPHTEREVLVAFQGDRRISQAPAAETLWRLSCVPPHRIEAAVHEPGADFGWAVSATGAAALYYPSRGVRMLETSTLARRDVAPPPPATPCAEASGRARGPSLLLLGMGDDGVLHATYGDYCHHEQWQGANYSLDGLAGSQPTWRRRTPIATVAVVAGSRLLLGDFAGCDSVPIGTPGTLFASDDDAARFRPVELPPTEGDPSPVAALATSTDGRDVVALTATCSFGERPPWGGQLTLSRDGGHGFVALPSPFFDRDSETHQGSATSVELPSGSLDRIVVSGLAYDGDQSCRSYQSTDFGRTWNALAPPLCPPPSTTAETQRARYLATADGLIRHERRAASPERVYPAPQLP